MQYDMSKVTGLTHNKTAHIIARDGFAMTGFVLTHEDGRKCIVDMSAVRWFHDKKTWADVMFPEGGQESMHTELAARDLVIQKMREAARELRGLANHFDNMRIANVANEALALQSSTDALDAELAEAVAAEREACSQLLEEKSRRYTKDGTVGHIIAGCADAIRARGEQPTCKPK